MFRSRASGVAIALVLAGCSGLAPKDPDPTPINPTAVMETHLVNAGIKGFPVFESTTRTYTRSNMQRSESTAGSAGTITRLLGSANADARIERLERKLAWTLDAKNKQYVECPLKGCPGPIPRKSPERKSADEDRDAECRLKIGNTTFSVEPTGQQRSINGFDTEQYEVKWLVTFRDNASRKSTSTVSIDLWTTPVTPTMKDAMALEKAYARAHDKILGIDSDTDRMVVLPPEVGRMISSYLSPNVSPTDRAVFLAGAKKLDKVKGQPILMNVKWNFAGEACSMDETMKDIGDKPLFTFMSEVKSHRMEALHDSLFAPPKDYKRAK
ncbi:MAG: hypothetical protein HY067_01680 [Betaproteobacteria bacterium]|nr:hypothetical protein [Betaproteobacteria bacterium]